MINEDIRRHVLKVPASAWTHDVEADSEVRDGSWVADLADAAGQIVTTGRRSILRLARHRPWTHEQ
ncbi:hypothetical protein ACFRCM_31840 [Streptomyces halstedii]|uniref:hypothetical protein n=1 Tax=Streptomyces halstedii TaxID=1944 RepID=UPI0036776E9D